MTIELRENNLYIEYDLNSNLHSIVVELIENSTTIIEMVEIDKKFFIWLKI